MLKYSVLLLISFTIGISFAKTTDPITRSYLNYAQDLYNQQDAFVPGKKYNAFNHTITSMVSASMHVTNPHFQRTMKLKMWGKGTDFTLVRILSPAKDRGTSTLKVKKNLWNYLPKTNRVVKIPSSLMSQGWMGSDFSNNDIVRETRYVDEYTCSRKTQGKLVVLNCIPDKNSVVVWGKVIFYVTAKTGLPVHVDYYDDSMKLARVFKFSHIKKLGGHMLPSVIEITPQDKLGHLTRMTYSSITFHVKLPSGFFSIQSLQEGNV